jgi:hypothetical protein
VADDISGDSENFHVVHVAENVEVGPIGRHKILFPCRTFQRRQDDYEPLLPVLMCRDLYQAEDVADDEDSG